MNFLAWMPAARWGPGIVCSAVTTVAFDIHVLELYVPLWPGAVWCWPTWAMQ